MKKRRDVSGKKGLGPQIQKGRDVSEIRGEAKGRDVSGKRGLGPQIQKGQDVPEMKK